MIAQEHHDDEYFKSRISILRISITRRETLLVHPDSCKENHQHHEDKIKEEKLELANIKKIYPELFV